MKLLQFSDSHLGLIPYGIPERMLDMGRILDEVVNLARHHSVDLVVNAGDMFDQSKPDPFSVQTYRRFVDQLEKAGIPYLEVVGNHNRHDIVDKIGEGFWPSAIHDHVFCPGSEGWLVQSIRGQTVAAANWMPRERLLPFLEKMRENPPDVLVLHQRCGGFLPRIAGNAEVTFEELKGVARCVMIGDVHVWGVHGKSPETVIISTGPTEMTKVDEDPSTSVALVRLYAKDETPPDNDFVLVERILLHPRPQIIRNVRSEIELVQLEALVKLALDRGEKPMVTAIYTSNVQQGLEMLRERLKGKVLWRDVPEAEVDSSASYEAAKLSANTDMPGILGEIINDDAPLLQAAVSLWGSPEASGLIFSSLKDSIRSRHQLASPLPT